MFHIIPKILVQKYETIISFGPQWNSVYNQASMVFNFHCAPGFIDLQRIITISEYVMEVGYSPCICIATRSRVFWLFSKGCLNLVWTQRPVAAILWKHALKVHPWRVKRRGLDNLGVDNLFINQVLHFSAATRLTFSPPFIITLPSGSLWIKLPLFFI